jgi:hypothetical protein
MVNDLRLNVLVLKEPAGDKTYFVAQCLEYDIVAQAEMLSDLRNAFIKTFATNIVLALKHGIEPLSNLKPKFVSTRVSPGEYKEIADAVKRAGKHVRRIETL